MLFSEVTALPAYLDICLFLEKLILTIYGLRIAVGFSRLRTSSVAATAHWLSRPFLPSIVLVHSGEFFQITTSHTQEKKEPEVEGFNLPWPRDPC